MRGRARARICGWARGPGTEGKWGVGQRGAWLGLGTDECRTTHHEIDPDAKLHGGLLGMAPLPPLRVEKNVRETVWGSVRSWRVGGGDEVCARVRRKNTHRGDVRRKAESTPGAPPNGQESGLHAAESVGRVKKSVKTGVWVSTLSCVASASAPQNAGPPTVPSPRPRENPRRSSTLHSASIGALFSPFL
jgi:hypothetical protein